MKTLDCRAFRDLTFHFQADELAEAERQGYLEHAGNCERCARYLETEESFARFLRTRLRRETAPPDLRARIRHELERAAPARRRGLADWLRTPVSVGAAAALVLGLLLGPGLLSTPAGTLPGGERVHVMRTATVVDLQCDRAGYDFEQQVRCRHPRHFNALKVADGQYWNLSLGEDRARDIVLDPGWRGQRVVVEGDYYPALSTVRIMQIRRAKVVSL